jgi:hypothetical protein
MDVSAIRVPRGSGATTGYVSTTWGEGLVQARCPRTLRGQSDERGSASPFHPFALTTSSVHAEPVEA